MDFAPGLTRRLHLPVINTSNLRVAHLDGSIGVAGAKTFPPKRWGALQTFSPNVLAGSVAQLKRLLERINLRTVNAGPVDHSIFVITQLGDSPLSARFRDRLWDHFGVPVYELYVDEDARLLAHDCEVQEGWHIAKDVRFSVGENGLLLHRGGELARTGLNWGLNLSPCPCGRSEPRLLPALKVSLPSAPAISA